MADWDFVGANTKRMTHGIHPYPAMMIPQIAARLIDSYGRGARVLFDPFCGAGLLCWKPICAALMPSAPISIRSPDSSRASKPPPSKRAN